MTYQNPNKYWEERDKKIERRCSIKDKQIAYFNSVNAAINLVLGIKKSPNKDDIVKWRDWFYEEWQNWYIDNIPIEPTKVTKEDYIQAKEEAPQKQALQDVADTVIAEEEFNKEEALKQAEAEAEYLNQPPEL
jgi:hypothetical protein